MSTAGRKAKNTTAPVPAATSAFERAASAAGLTASKGKGAVKHQYQAGIASGPSLKFTGSVDMDEACRAAELNPTDGTMDWACNAMAKASSLYGLNPIQLPARVR